MEKETGYIILFLAGTDESLRVSSNRCVYRCSSNYHFWPSFPWPRDSNCSHPYVPFGGAVVGCTSGPPASRGNRPISNLVRISKVIDNDS
jgi:hypothetical protein